MGNLRDRDSRFLADQDDEPNGGGRASGGDCGGDGNSENPSERVAKGENADDGQKNECCQTNEGGCGKALQGKRTEVFGVPLSAGEDAREDSGKVYGEVMIPGNTGIHFLGRSVGVSLACWAAVYMFLPLGGVVLFSLGYVPLLSLVTLTNVVTWLAFREFREHRHLRGKFWWRLVVDLGAARFPLALLAVVFGALPGEFETWRLTAAGLCVALAGVLCAVGDLAASSRVCWRCVWERLAAGARRGLRRRAARIRTN